MNQPPIVGIIDYQMGNLRSVSKGIQRAGGIPVVSESFCDLKSASHLILPGVGAFRDAIAQIRQRDWIGFIEDWIAADKPFLGICLGLQMLLEVSFEGGEHPGLGIIKGKVIKFQFEDSTLKVPHMGWNQVRSTQNASDPLLRGLGQSPYFQRKLAYKSLRIRILRCNKTRKPARDTISPREEPIQRDRFAWKLSLALLTSTRFYQSHCPGCIAEFRPVFSLR
jgi:glutamine amidotransferase